MVISILYLTPLRNERAVRHAILSANTRTHMPSCLSDMAIYYPLTHPVLVFHASCLLRSGIAMLRTECTRVCRSGTRMSMSLGYTGEAKAISQSEAPRDTYILYAS